MKKQGLALAAAGLAMAAWMGGGCAFSGSTTASVGGTYIPTDEIGPMTAGLDDHDYDLAVRAVTDEMKKRGLKKDYVVALGSVDTSGTPYSVRVEDIQRSMETVFNQEGSLQFQVIAEGLDEGKAQGLIMKLKKFNWESRQWADDEDAEILGTLARVDGLLVGRVSSTEAMAANGRKQVMYRFVWRLINVRSGILDIAYEYKLGKQLAQ